MANRIRELRKSKKMTMRELGAVVGLAESTISQYETGKIQPDNETLLKLGEFFDVTVDYILSRNRWQESEPKSKGKNMRNAREKAGFSQKQVALSLGVSAPTVSEWESGKKNPNAANLQKLSALYGVTTDFLLEHSAADPKFKFKGVRIPVLGSVPVGIPMEAIEDIVDYEEIGETLAATGEFFGLRIRGDSMEPRMMEGDVVIVRLQDDVDSGDTAIVLVNGNEATCKKIKKTPDGVMLIPTNPAHEPWFYSNEEIQALPVRILGKVVELRAKY